MNEQEALDLVAEGDRLNDELLAQRAGGTLEVSQVPPGLRDRRQAIFARLMEIQVALKAWAFRPEREFIEEEGAYAPEGAV